MMVRGNGVHLAYLVESLIWRSSMGWLVAFDRHCTLWNRYEAYCLTLMSFLLCMYFAFLIMLISPRLLICWSFSHSLDSTLR